MGHTYNKVQYIFHGPIMCGCDLLLFCIFNYPIFCVTMKITRSVPRNAVAFYNIVLIIAV